MFIDLTSNRTSPHEGTRVKYYPAKTPTAIFTFCDGPTFAASLSAYNQKEAAMTFFQKPANQSPDLVRVHNRPKTEVDAEEPFEAVQRTQPLDEIDEASMESFPCSDPPAYTHAHA